MRAGTFSKSAHPDDAKHGRLRNPIGSRRSVHSRRARQTRAECRGRRTQLFFHAMGQEPPPTPPFSFPLGSRRTIILSAIRRFEPRRSSESGKPDLASALTIDNLPLASQVEVSAILELPLFERFVFVMSALERYSDRECSILLGCAPREVTAARTRALRQVGRLMMHREDESVAEYENSGAHESLAPSIELTIARYFIASTGNGILSHDAPLWP